MTARKILSEKDKYVIFETETTGLKSTDVILWITFMDLDGNVLLDELLQLPKRKRIDQNAQDKHGVSREVLKKAKTIKELIPDIEDICLEKGLLVYNEEFHTRLLDQTLEAHGLTGEIKMRTFCVQNLHNKYQDRSYSKLRGRDNTGEGDCMAVINLLKEMANAEIMQLPEPESEPQTTYSHQKVSEKKMNPILKGCLIVFLLFIGLSILSSLLMLA